MKVKLILVLILIAVLGLIWMSTQKSTLTSETPTDLTALGEPSDTVIDFYEAWITERKTDPTVLPGIDLFTQFLGLEAKQQIQEGGADFAERSYDPALCSTYLPQRVRSRNVFKTEREAQVLVLLNDDTNQNQVLATLAPEGEQWVITNIQCNADETPPEQGEFTFEQVGYLLKNSLEAPYDKTSWHLVYEQRDTPGYVVPLTLDGSQCIDTSGQTHSCDPTTLYEAQHVHIKGTMEEAGVEVAFIEFVSN